MKNRGKILILAVIVLIIILIGSLNRPAATQEIKIGVIATLTGPGAYFGEQVVSGVQIAADELNSKGGINGKKVRLIIEDSKTDNTTALTVAKKLVETDGVSVIIGDTWNGTTLTIMPYTNEKKVILIASNSSLDAFTGDDYMFRLIPRTSEFVAPLARYLYSHGVKTVAFARINTAFTQEHFQDFKQDYEKLGGMIVADETFVSPGLDVRSELTKIKQKKPDAVFDIHNSGPSIGLLVAQAHQVGLETKWISTWATENGALMKQYPEEIEGMIYPFMYDESSSQNSKIFADKIRNMGKTADFYVACGYDIVNLVARAMKDININNTDEIKASLLSIKDYDGATGRFGFDSNGDVTRDIFIKTVKDGKFVKVGE